MIQSWFSSEDGKQYRLTQQPDIAFGGDEVFWPKIYVDSSIKYQKMLGVGSSLEESTVYNLSQLPEHTYKSILKQLLDPEEGIGWNVIRVCFGSSDFTGREYYSYCDMPPGKTDPELTNFSIQKDIDYNIIKFVQTALEINPDIKVFASPWSPPGWMKDSGSMCGGSLLEEYIDTAAIYYRRCVQAYETLGIPIYAFTLQNEPNMVHESYPTCWQTWQAHQKLLKAVGREFREHGLKTLLWILDHNYDMAMSYAAKILQDKESYDLADGVAFHDYVGEPVEMSTLHNHFPQKNFYLTERSVWGTYGMDRIIQYFRNWCKCYVAWVTCLDENRQPNSGCHPADPTFVTYNPEVKDSWYFIPEYWLVGQISKFVQRGAHRIESNYGSVRDVTNIAFENPDGSIIVIVINQNDEEKQFSIHHNESYFNTALPAKTVATYKWNLK